MFYVVSTPRKPGIGERVAIFERHKDAVDDFRKKSNEVSTYWAVELKVVTESFSLDYINFSS